MSKRLPYFQFEPAEWLAGDIMFCSLSAQGLFTTLKALYWQKDCDLLLEQAIKRLKNEELFEELISEKIIKIKSNKIKINFLDEQWDKLSEKSKINSKNGALGGRPKKQTETENKPNGFNSLSENESETKALRREEIRREEIRREEKKEEEKKEEEIREDSAKALVGLENPPDPPTETKINYQKLIDFFNSNRGNLPAIKILSEPRKKRISAIVKKYGKENLQKVILDCKNSDFIQGNNGREWRADFDWITQPKNFIKILEGNYKNKTNGNSNNNSGSNSNSGYKPATVDREKLIQELTDDVANGNIPGMY
jgi:hypothetical protein